MASFRSFPPPPPPPNQNPLPPPPPPPPAPAPGPPNNQFHPNRGGTQVPTSSYPPNYHPNPAYGTSSHNYGRPQQPAPPPPPPQQGQQPYPYMPPPPPMQSSYPTPAPPPPPMTQQPNSNSQPPPPPMYYPYSVPPPPPTSPPPNSSAPPPPPPSAPPPSLPPPPPPPSSSAKENRPSNHHHHGHNNRPAPPKDPSSAGWQQDSRHSSRHGVPSKQQKPFGHPSAAGKPSQPHGGRVETEEERRVRKKREYEKQRQDDKHRQQMKMSQNAVLQKPQVMASGGKVHGSLVGSRMGERKATPFLSSERIENRLKKPTTFLCKLKFRNELPDPTAQPKLMSYNTNKDQYAKYTITSLEKMHKPKLFVEPDLGIPLDLLDISVYNPPSVRPPLAPEDEELLRDAEVSTPVKQDGIKRKERPTDKGVSWLVKTQYISPLSMEAAKLSLTEKQAKELRESRGGRNILDNLNDREKQIQAIEASFEACKSRPVHATNKRLQPVEVLPLLPDFARYKDKFVLAAFDNDPTADSEIYSKLDKSVREEHESRAIMKSFVVNASDTAKPDKFLAYMAPSPDELWKDIYDDSHESEDISYSWVREYNWDVPGEEKDKRETYLVTFGKDSARYLPLPTKLVLRKRRARDGRSGPSGEEAEPYPVPSSVTVRRRPAASAAEHKEPGGYSNSKGNTSSLKRGRPPTDDSYRSRHKVGRAHYMDSGVEELSD